MRTVSDPDFKAKKNRIVITEGIDFLLPILSRPRPLRNLIESVLNEGVVGD